MLKVLDSAERELTPDESLIERPLEKEEHEFLALMRMLTHPTKH